MHLITGIAATLGYSPINVSIFAGLKHLLRVFAGVPSARQCPDIGVDVQIDLGSQRRPHQDVLEVGHDPPNGVDGVLLEPCCPTFVVVNLHFGSESICFSLPMFGRP